VIVLSSAELLVRLDPGHGGEILDLVDLQTGRQLLGRPPFASAEPLPGNLDEETWTARYRGGWQLAAPNAGSACEVNGVRHGFHGRASNDPWEVVDSSVSACALRWSGHGLRIERGLALVEGSLEVSVEFTGLAARAPLVALEHIALGAELLDPEVEIELAGGRAFELSESEGPPEPPAGAPAWPEALLLDGSRERCDRWPISRPRSRLLAVADLPEGRALVRNAATGQRLELVWEADWLRHLWLWHEVRTYGGPWRQAAEVLVVEPSSVPHSLGLAAAVDHGQARWLAEGERLAYRLTARASS
jgi:hypothetical protein